MKRAITVHNAQAVAADEIPLVSLASFQEALAEVVRSGKRLSALTASPIENDCFQLMAVVSDDAKGHILLLGSLVERVYPSLTPKCPQAHLFERELAEEFGLEPCGHPGLKPVRFLTSDKPGVTDFFRVHGDAIHEVAVGPVHAGVIEPGHFRFQCAGEEVLHLEIALGFQHRGVLQALKGPSTRRAIPVIETVAGDTTVGHTLAYAQALEALAGIRVPPRAQGIRGIALELERIANHVGDLGALAGDVGFLPTASFCGRLRGDVLNLTALLCGNRFGRALIRPGGVLWDLEDKRDNELLSRLEKLTTDLTASVDLLWDSPSVLSRFEETGTLSEEQCRHLGLVGIAARACGIEHDVRQDFPCGIYRFFQVPASTWHTGDVFARAFVRWLEIVRATSFIREQVAALAGGPILVPERELAPDQLVVSLVEGWRGEICHVVQTSEQGQIASYRIVDPSFHNWSGLALALQGQQISDFPLCNKSFNLSYCGHDL